MTVEINAATGVSAVQPGSVQSGDLAAGAIGSGDLPAGSVLQVVQTDSSTLVANSSNSFIDTGLSASITPSSSSNKLLVIISQNVHSQGTGDGDHLASFRIVRESDVLRTYTAAFKTRFATGADGFGFATAQVSLVHLDTPNTTSQITYKTEMKKDGTADLVSVAENNTPSTITLMEIAG